MASGINNPCLVVFLVFLAVTAFQVNGERSFSIDYDHDTFIKDGKPFRYISGSIHYSRVPAFYWRDRLEKMYAGGLNAISVYIPWNYHELTPGNYSFDGGRDIVAFIKLAQEIGFVVILRPGPYICGEWDFGGLPGWILKDSPGVVVRSSDPDYIEPVDRWMDVLLPLLKPLLYINGGPIITVQVENEYGSYFACDYDYLRYLREKFIQHFGSDVVLFSTDGAGVSYLTCGTLEGVYATVDFGMSLNPAKVFENSQRKFEPRGPLVNSEFYAGWLDHWGYPFVTVNGSAFAHSLDLLLQTGANVNIYMFHGGTNFGYTNGANYKPIQSHITSYDYDAPLNEAGDITQKYTEIRKVIAKYRKLPSGPVPPSTTKTAYGRLQLNYKESFTKLFSTRSLNHATETAFPLTMEHVGKEGTYAYFVYDVVLNSDYSSAYLDLSAVRDRGYVYLDTIFQGIITRDNITAMILSAKKGQQLSIMVENLGHINYGSGMVNNSKGLISNVIFGGSVLQGWMTYPIYLEEWIQETTVDRTLRFKSDYKLEMPEEPSLNYTPALWTGEFQIPQFHILADTFLDPRPFSKGHAFINGFNLGRYWPTSGPQVTLFVPKSVLKPYPQFNTVTLFEVESAPCSMGRELPSCYVSFVDKPFLNKAVGNREDIYSKTSSRMLSWDYDWRKEH